MLKPGPSLSLLTFISCSPGLLSPVAVVAVAAVAAEAKTAAAAAAADSLVGAADAVAD